MNILLDTHVLIWYLEGNTKLKERLRDAIANPEHTIFISVVTPWEMSLKAKKLLLQLPFDSYFADSEYRLLPITLLHIQEVRKLPMHHKDPFDRMLIAQARVEECTLITLDKKFQKYRVPILE